MDSILLRISANTMKLNDTILRLNARDEAIILYLAFQKNLGFESVPTSEFLKLGHFEQFHAQGQDKLTRALYTRAFERDQKYKIENQNLAYFPIFEYIRNGNQPALQFSAEVQVELSDEDWVMRRLGLESRSSFVVDGVQNAEAQIANAIALIHRGRPKEGKEILERVNRQEDLPQETKIVALAQTAYLLESFSIEEAEGALAKLERELDSIILGKYQQSSDLVGEFFSQTRIQEFKATLALRWGRIFFYRYQSDRADQKLREAIQCLINTSQDEEWIELKNKQREKLDIELWSELKQTSSVNKENIAANLEPLNEILSQVKIWGTINPLMAASALTAIGENLVQTIYQKAENTNAGQAQKTYQRIERSSIEIGWGIKAIELALNLYHCTQYIRGVTRAFSLLAWSMLIKLEQTVGFPRKSPNQKIESENYEKVWKDIEAKIQDAERYVINAATLSKTRSREDASCYEELGFSQIYYYRGRYQLDEQKALKELEEAQKWIEKAQVIAMRIGNVRQIGTVYLAFARLLDAKYEITGNITDFDSRIKYLELAAEQADKAGQDRRRIWLTEHAKAEVEQRRK
jgi:hypothetical protein